MYLKISEDVSLRYVVNKVSNAKGIVVINHGFAEHVGRYDHVTKRLNSAGYNVYRYDLRGHGRSLGPKGHIDSYESFISDCHAFVTFARNDTPEVPMYMLGHSMGGLVTAMYGIAHPDMLRGQVLSGPAITSLPKSKGLNGFLLKTVGVLMPSLKISNPVEDDVCSVPEVVAHYKADEDVLRKATAGFLKEFLIEGPAFVRAHIHQYMLPCFIAHGGDDTIVPVEVSEYFYDNIASQDKERKVYPGLYHEILNENEKDEILDDMILWMDARL
ncbi:alpha/beta hydrolase [Erysipelothrix sp. HDW6C]|uniref:alpha/beta hydrolase n=1 Tax=Erysipelothrix sp. HDW6C TaxID=2714930 RepID=UPI00140A727C|nr:alpha/beta hydrolase [Erysipelothrix sp. HDW6C]QIK70804.1 alpha/beta hydrolase [Erysipelothrix sp. HDW6C]